MFLGFLLILIKFFVYKYSIGWAFVAFGLLIISYLLGAKAIQYDNSYYRDLDTIVRTSKLRDKIQDIKDYQEALFTISISSSHE